MSFLEKIVPKIISNEKEMLRSLRKTSEEWFNELTDPFLLVLNPTFNASDLSPEQQTQLKNEAEKIWTESVKVNQGDEVANKLAEIKLSSGIPYFSGRKELREKIQSYLKSGDFLKKFFYGSFLSDDREEVQGGIEMARELWMKFKEDKDSLVQQINDQLAKIG